MPREFALPGTRPKYARDRVVDVEHLKLVLDVDPDARKVSGVAHLQCAVIAAGTRWVELDAVELAIAPVEVVVTIPRRFFALSNGELLTDETKGERRTLHWRLDVPHSCYLVTLAIGDLATLEHRWRDILVTYHVARGREAECERTLARTPR